MSSTLPDKALTRKYNILQIVPALNCGGVERGTIDIARALHEAGHIPYVLSSGGSLCESLASAGATLIKHDVATKTPITIYRNISYIANIIKKNGIDLVHARSRASAWSAFYAAKKHATPFVTTFHGIYNIRSMIKRYYNSVMTYGHRVIAVSNFVKEHILSNYKIDESIIRVIHRGVDLEYFSPSPIEEKTRTKFVDKYNIKFDSPLIVMPSRLTSWKGQHILVEALARIKHLDFYCILAGDLSKHPDYVQRLKNLIIHHKLQSKVQIFGQEIDVVGLYNMSNIVISASIEPEAFGRSIVEAQAMRKLVIATNIGGAAETIEDEITGFHVEPKNIGQMAERIKYALSIIGTQEEEKIVSLARASVVKHFSLKKCNKVLWQSIQN